MRIVWATLLAASLSTIAAPAAAQQAVESRVDRLEREMRAVQRRVFPGGAGQTVEPDIAPVQAPVEAAGTPAGGALADLTARVAALEAGLRAVTGESEQNGYRLRQLDEAFGAYRRATDARIKALEDAAAAPAGGPVAEAAPPTPTAVAATGDTARTPARTPTRAPAPRPAATARPAAADAADPERAAAVAAIARPATGDEADDLYTYGFRLWEAKLYPEAQAALKPVAERFPNHRRASFAQNLLGRAYLDDGKPSLASLAFYDGYKKFPEGARAPDSLFYLAQALVRLRKPAADVCKVYTELTEVYGGRLTPAMRADVARGRTAQRCP